MFEHSIVCHCMHNAWTHASSYAYVCKCVGVSGTDCNMLHFDSLFLCSFMCSYFNLFQPQEYKALTLKADCPQDVWVYLGCALFFLGLYKEAEEAALKGSPLTSLVIRLALSLDDLKNKSFFFLL